MFDLTPGNKFKLRNFKIISEIYANKYNSIFRKTTAFVYLTHLKDAINDGVVTIDYEKGDYIYIKEQTNLYPGRIYIHEWMIEKHIAE